MLYGSECWTPLRKHYRKLNAFHHRCIRTIMGISNRQQWIQRISMSEIRRRWGDLETAVDKITKRRLEWLGHVARMPDERIPKSAMFGWLPQPRPRCGPRKRRRDVIKKDLAEIDVDEKEWYKEACRSREEWRAMCRLGLESHAEEQAKTQACEQATRGVMCDVC